MLPNQSSRAYLILSHAHKDIFIGKTGAYTHRNAFRSINLILLAKNGRIFDASVIHCRIDLLTY